MNHVDVRLNVNLGIPLMTHMSHVVDLADAMDYRDVRLKGLEVGGVLLAIDQKGDFANVMWWGRANGILPILMGY